MSIRCDDRHSVFDRAQCILRPILKLSVAGCRRVIWSSGKLRKVNIAQIIVLIAGLKVLRRSESNRPQPSRTITCAMFTILNFRLDPMTCRHPATLSFRIGRRMHWARSKTVSVITADGHDLAGGRGPIGSTTLPFVSGDLTTKGQAKSPTVSC